MLMRVSRGVFAYVVLERNEKSIQMIRDCILFVTLWLFTLYISGTKPMKPAKKTKWKLSDCRVIRQILGAENGVIIASSTRLINNVTVVLTRSFSLYNSK